MYNLDRVISKLSLYLDSDNEYSLPANQPFWQILLEQKYTPEYINECIEAEGDTEAVINRLLADALDGTCFICNPTTGEVVFEVCDNGDLIDAYTGEVLNAYM